MDFKFKLIKSMTLFFVSLIFCIVFTCGCIFHFYTGLPVGSRSIVIQTTTAIGTMVSIAWLITSTLDLVKGLKENAKEKYVMQWDDSLIEHWDGVLPPHMGSMHLDPQYDGIEHFDGIFPPVPATREVGILEDIVEEE